MTTAQPTISRTAKRAAAGLGAGLLALVLVSCSSGGSPSDNGASRSGPANAAPASLRTVQITLREAGCRAAHASYNTGPLTFTVSNVDATAVSELEILSKDRILGEKENLAPGFKSTFSLDLQPGTYTLYCPGANAEKTPLTITGKATATKATDTKALLIAGSKNYQVYVATQISSLQDAVRPLVSAIKTGNLTQAQTAYAKARPYYERIEPVAESFPKLDPAIDARADDGVKPTQLSGFHRLEYGLFTVKSTAGLAAAADGLAANVAKLKTQAAALPGFQPAELANGAVSLLEEAATSKISGEEERYAHVDLLDFAGNVEGSQQALAYLEDGLIKLDPALLAQIKKAFTSVIALLNTYKDATQPSGYRSYTSLTPADTKKLAQALQAVQEPLSRVAGKVVRA